MMEPHGHTAKENVHVLLGDISPVADTPDSLRRPGRTVFRSEQCPGRWPQFKRGINMSYIEGTMSSCCWGQIQHSTTGPKE